MGWGTSVCVDSINITNQIGAHRQAQVKISQGSATRRLYSLTIEHMKHPKPSQWMVKQAPTQAIPGSGPTKKQEVARYREPRQRTHS